MKYYEVWIEDDYGTKRIGNYRSEAKAQFVMHKKADEEVEKRNRANKEMCEKYGELAEFAKCDVYANPAYPDVVTIWDGGFWMKYFISEQELQ